MLRREAARHEPDSDRMRALLAGAMTEARTDQRPGRRVARLAWSLGAASMALLTLTAVAAAQVLASSGHHAAVTSATSSAGASTSPGIAASVSGSPSASNGPATPRPSAASSTVTTGPGTHANPGKPPGLSQAVSIRVMPVPYPAPLSLPAAGIRDWIAVGSRPDGQLVRANTPTRPLGTVEVSGYGPSIVNGPYQLSWTGGTPDQTRSGDGTWQSITAVDGRLRITVPWYGDRYTVDLFAGTVKTTGLVRVQAPNSSSTVSATIAPCAVDVCADVVSVTVDSSLLPAPGDLVIDLGPAQPGNGLGLGLAAVVLR